MSIKKRLAVSQNPSTEVSHVQAVPKYELPMVLPGIRITEVWHESEVPAGTPWWMCPSELRRRSPVVQPPKKEVPKPEIDPSMVRR